jgi:hypothetical protein
MAKIARVRMLAETALALGLGNIARFTRYRLSLRFGVNAAMKLGGTAPCGPYFLPIEPSQQQRGLDPVRGWEKGVCLFGRHHQDLPHGLPDFLANPFTGNRAGTGGRPWWAIPDFTVEAGDIKATWELSRFTWAPIFAQQACAGDTTGVDRLNTWIAHWCAQNPPYAGPNWKCGQEASVRVMQLAITVLLLGQAKAATPDLTELIALHATRIAPTIDYAIAQDNNHGTSEAAALFIAGSWPGLANDPRAAHWLKTGRKWLENRVVRLIGREGTFSLYSTNYHRVLLDTLSIAELWRRHVGQSSFSPSFHARALAAIDWLRALTDEATGDAPNAGNNDGARLLTLCNADFRDYRPAVQLAAKLFMDRAAYEDGPWNDLLRWLDLVPARELLPPRRDRIAADGGFALLRRGEAAVLLRFPRFRFRPAQADALHLDLTIAGRNWLRDGGSFSYHADPEVLDYFGGVRSHNTVQFDGHDQMPRIGRFLYGAWPQAEIVRQDLSGDIAYFAARYRDWRGAAHTRTVALSTHSLDVIDNLDGFTHSATLRWRLAHGAWERTEDGVEQAGMRIAIASDQHIARMEIVTGSESRYYFESTPLPVLEIELHAPGTITSRFDWEGVAA